MKVVVPVQDAKCADTLGAFIRNYPWPTDMEFQVAHIVQPVLVNSFMSLLPAPLTLSIIEERTREGEVIVKRLSDTIKEAFPSARVSEVLIEGDAKSEIVSLLEESDADLVVLGSHVKTAMQGSVSRAVVAHSPCSAMVIPIEQREPKKTKDKLHIIV
ncbi:MAG: universal stress protein [Candidatus Melainabacteria bacterium]|nr:universal stress protein [Candidatus Melainabacteria bacterium]